MTRSSQQTLLMTVAFVCFTACAPPQDKRQQEREQAREQLKLLADYLAEKQIAAKGPWPEPPDVKLPDLLAHLRLFHEGDAVRLQAIALARKYASPSDLLRRPDPGAGYHRHAHARLVFAWSILMETGCLRKGMRLEDAVAVLGAPTKVWKDGIVDWAYDSTMHVNPCLRCKMKGDLIEAIEIVMV